LCSFRLDRYDGTAWRLVFIFGISHRSMCCGAAPQHADGEDLGDVTEAIFDAERGAVAVLA